MITRTIQKLVLITLITLLSFLPISSIAENNNSFNGYYLGGGLGYSHGKVSEGNTDWIEDGLTPYLTSGKNSNFNHALFNINAGYNFQLNNKSILGFEIDNSTVNQTANGEALNYDISFTRLSDRVISKTKIDNIQTLRLKYGFEQNNIYYYITGGLALTEIKRKVTGLDDGESWAYLGFGESNEKTSFESGYALGAGMEMPIKENLKFSLKYIYTDFGNIKYNYKGHVFGHTNVGNQKVGLDNSMLTIGLNYHF